MTETKGRAVIVREFGRAGSFKLEEYDPGGPGPDQVRVAVHSCAVSYLDTLVTSGLYQIRPTLPFVAGSECSGVIVSVGQNVCASRLGEQVALVGFNLGLADFATVEASAAEKCPKNFDFDEGAAFRVSYTTAYYALKLRGGLIPGETLLVLGASGAVGLAAIQVGKALGAKVIAAASDRAKQQMALSAGADLIVDARAPDFREQLLAINDGRRPDIVLDPVGGPVTDAALRSVAWNGRLLVVGFASGTIPKFSTNLCLLKGASVIGVDIRRFADEEPEAAAAVERAVLELAEAGHLRPAIGATYPLEQFADAMDAVIQGHSLGRVIVRMER